jgi:hypothetical protein
MENRPLVVEKNCETGEEIVRPYTDEEMEQRAKDIAAFEASEVERLAEEQAKADTKAAAIAKLTALGLTEEEANALAGN